MEPWIILLLLSLTLTLTLPFLLSKLKTRARPLPPGPSTIAFFAKNVIFQKKSLFQLEQVIHELHKTYGPIMSLQTPPHPTIFIEDRGIAHQALVQLGPAIADRPPVKEPNLYLTCDGHDISSASYGSLWRLLRRNLTSEMLHPSCVKNFAPARSWASKLLVNRLISTREEEGVVMLREKLRFTMFCLLVALCFGEKLDEEQIEEIRDIQNSLLLLFTRFNFFGFLPRVAKVVFREKWNEIVGIRRRQAEIFTPLIRARKEENSKLERINKSGAGQIFVPYCYVDSLLNLEIPEEGGRKLSEEEIVNLCHEFLSGGTDTTSNGLEWIMAEIVKRQEIQKKLAEEVERVIPASEDEVEVKEEDLKKMPYLKAVIMEGLRRHPPGHFVLPHRASQDVELNKYLIPKGSEVHVNVAQLGWDEKVWEDPMDFRPERFMSGGGFCGELVDITGSREIKMMPFGAGRRICPGYGLAILHLEYFLANLVREFEWKAVEGEEIDLSEEFEFTVVMKNPLRARIFPRGKKL